MLPTAAAYSRCLLPLPTAAATCARRMEAEERSAEGPLEALAGAVKGAASNVRCEGGRRWVGAVGQLVLEAHARIRCAAAAS